MRGAGEKEGEVTEAIDEEVSGAEGREA